MVGLLMFAAACGSQKSARELCEESARAYCDKVFDCPEGQDRRADEGGTKEACVTQNLTFCPVDAPCGGSEPNYHQDKAEQCAEQYQALTCSAFGANPNLPVCDEICTP
jgi:hypothetical protein